MSDNTLWPLEHKTVDFNNRTVKIAIGCFWGVNDALNTCLLIDLLILAINVFKKLNKKTVAR